MAIKALVADELGTHHLIIGLNREDIDSLLNGDVFTLPPGLLSGLSEESDVVLLFAETDEELRLRFPAVTAARLAMPRKPRTDPRAIRAEIHKLTAGGKTRKTMACGHEDHVYAGVDETKEVCWACRMGGKSGSRHL